jgi:hypothetical protein
MGKAIPASTIKRKKPGLPKTTGPGEQVVLRLHDSLLSNVDRWRTAQADAPTRAEALRRLADLGLSAPATEIPRIIASGDALAAARPKKAGKVRVEGGSVAPGLGSGANHD